MSIVAPPSSSNLPDKPRRRDDPDDYRMSFGDHLEELRSRLIRALVGYLLAVVVCLIFVRDHVLPFFCDPLLSALKGYNLSPQLYAIGTDDVFSLYIKVSLIAGSVIGAPWILYQVWQFIAAGLYPSERKVVTRYIPVSILLLAAGVSFAFFVVLPMTLQFFLYFAMQVPLPPDFQPAATTQPVANVTSISRLVADPAAPVEGNIWINTSQNRVKLFSGGSVQVMPFGPSNLIAPLITIPDYIGLVLMLLLLFGVSFQLPLVVMLLVRVGIFELDELRGMRRIVYFILVIIAALITPGDVITATIALLLPLIGLYELGLVLASRGERRASGVA
jgi:sec-independent protein translocase protein TatC